MARNLCNFGNRTKVVAWKAATLITIPASLAVSHLKKGWRNSFWDTINSLHGLPVLFFSDFSHSPKRGDYKLSCDSECCVGPVMGWGPVHQYFLSLGWPPVTAEEKTMCVWAEQFKDDYTLGLKAWHWFGPTKSHKIWENNQLKKEHHGNKNVKPSLLFHFYSMLPITRGSGCVFWSPQKLSKLARWWCQKYATSSSRSDGSRLFYCLVF